MSDLKDNQTKKEKGTRDLQTPYYIIYEERLRRNLTTLKEVSERSGVKIIMAFKANALWKTFPIIKEYFSSSTASSINEMKLSLDYFGDDVHAYCPVYTEETFPEFLNGCTHITFNSVAQFEKYYPAIKEYNSCLPDGKKRVSPGLRINPRCSVIETEIYNPCIPGSRFGVDAENLKSLPEGIEGLHFHALCESSSYDLEKVLNALELQFGDKLDRVKWLNMGGGHLITKVGYDIEHFISLIEGLRNRHPGLEIIIEPGSAFTWQTGDLVTKVLDVVENAGIKTGIIDASFACHAPDCLEMPYRPAIAEAISDEAEGEDVKIYRLGGNSCLSGDFVGDWKFNRDLVAGDLLTLKDMNHYTTVKTNMFNGIQHPSIWLQDLNGEKHKLREYTYEDYRDRMD
ncbi:MAG: carboxynorspermidine decarboxylase [Muribaculaceae bacterium]|nr:carboxynorspermidine decarboxylase [Muribaculaceae bacterium]